MEDVRSSWAVQASASYKKNILKLITSFDEAVLIFMQK